MRGYSGIELSNTACVRFVRNAEIDGSEREIFDEARRRGVRSAYIDSSSSAELPRTFANVIAEALRLDNAPYESKQWLCLSDDLITLAYRERGLVITVDNAWVLLERHQDELFDLVEAFLSQLHHWLQQGKPCHLCLQMESNADVARFARDI